MKHKAEEFMQKLADRKNTLAMTYLALLKDAPEEVRQYWFDRLEESMKPQENQDVDT